MRSIFGTSRTTLAVLSLVLGGASFAGATDITYSVDQTVGTGSLTGDIVTDGTIGVLASGDIVDWNLLLNDGTHMFALTGPMSGGNSNFDDLAGSGDLSATATQLTFDFSGSGTNYFDFMTTAATQLANGNLQSDVCFQSSDADCGGTGAGDVLTVLGGATQFTALSGTQVIATVSTTSPSVPEPSTLAMVFAAFLGIGYRARKRY